METTKRLKEVITSDGRALLDLNEVAGVLPKSSRDGMPYIILRCGFKIFFDEYHLNKLKTELNKL